MSPAVLITSLGEGILDVRLNRPAVMNAVDRNVVTRLLEVIGSRGQRVIVIGSTDARSFCSGVDTNMSDGERAEVSDLLYELYDRILRSSALVIVVLRGHVVGAGVQLSLAADIRVGAADVMFRFVGLRFGLAVGAWGLPSLIGRGRAMELCVSGRPLDGEEASRIGLLDMLHGDPTSAALDLARQASVADPGALHRLKRIVIDSSGLRGALCRERLENRAAWSGGLATG